MTISDFSKIAAAIRTYYPDSKILMTKEEVALWFDMFQTVDYALCASAVKQWVATNDRPPRVSNLLELCNTTITGGFMNESEAWDMVYKAICRASSYAEEDFNSFPDEIKRAIGSPATMKRLAMDEGFDHGVESSNFKRAYRAACEQARKKQQTPANVRILTQQTAARLEG